jgi:hypothetical protein
MEVKTIHSFQGCGCVGRVSSASHSVGWVDAANARDPPLFVASETSHDSGVKKANVLSLPLINLGGGFKPPLQLSPMT